MKTSILVVAALAIMQAVTLADSWLKPKFLIAGSEKDLDSVVQMSVDGDRQAVEQLLLDGTIALSPAKRLPLFLTGRGIYERESRVPVQGKSR
jgi:hypothetical protein